MVNWQRGMRQDHSAPCMCAVMLISSYVVVGTVAEIGWEPRAGTV